MNQSVQTIAHDRAVTSGSVRRFWRAGAWVAVVAVATYYVLAYALVYFFPGSPELGRHRTHAVLLLPHILGGMVALLVGPIQFVPSIREKHRSFHRVVGRIYLISIAVSGMVAYLAIRRRQIAQHREWMIRSYVVTFGFVNFRLLLDGLNAAGVPSSPERSTYVSFLCWALPLLLTEAVLQGRKILSAPPAPTTSVPL